MAYTKDEISKKIGDMYPEIEGHNISMTVEFNEEKNAWIIDLEKGEHGLATHLDKKDADDCMEGIKCVYLGVKIGEFVQNFEEGEKQIG